MEHSASEYIAQYTALELLFIILSILASAFFLFLLGLLAYELVRTYDKPKQF